MNVEDYTISGVSLENIRNKYEIIVIRLMKELASEFPDFDNCPICLEDVYALSLSRIPSTYVSNDSLIDKEEEIDDSMREIVRYAIFQVMSKPKHNTSDAL